MEQVSGYVLVWGSPWNRKAGIFPSPQLAEKAAIGKIRDWLKFCVERCIGENPTVEQFSSAFEETVSTAPAEWAVKWFAYNNHLPGGDEWICQVVPLYESAD